MNFNLLCQYQRIIDDQWMKRMFFHVYADLDMSRGYSTLKYVNSDSKRMSPHESQLYDHFWLFCHVYVHLLQNWGSDNHFEVLNMPKSWLDQKLCQKTQKVSFHFTILKKKAENICLINGHFKTSSGRFLANYTAVFLKTEDQMVILRCLTCLNLNWIKCYDIMLVKVFFLCLQMPELRGTLWSEFLIPQIKISSHIFKIACTETYNTSF